MGIGQLVNSSEKVDTQAQEKPASFNSNSISFFFCLLDIEVKRFIAQGVLDPANAQKFYNNPFLEYRIIPRLNAESIDLLRTRLKDYIIVELPLRYICEQMTWWSTL